MHSDPKPAIGRAVPFREKYPKLGHMKGHFCLHILFAGVDNKTDTHAFRFSEQNISWKNWKLKKNSFDHFCVNKFYDMIKIQKMILICLKTWISKK